MRADQGDSAKALESADSHGGHSVRPDFAQLADTLPSMVWTCDSEGRANFFNARWYEFTGRTFEQTKDFGWSEVIHADDRDRVLAEWEKAVQNPERYEVELRYRMKDGTYRWHQVRATPVFNDSGKVDHWFGISTDIDKQHESAEASAALTQAIVETAVDAIITIDERGSVESCNPATERLFGYAASEIAGQNVSMLMPEPYHSEHDGYIANYLRTGEKKIIGIGREVVGRRKDGSTFPIELAVSEVRVRGRRIFTGIVRDITERVQARTELAAKNAVFETIVNGIPDVLLLADLDRKLTHVNPGTCRTFGCEPEELIGQPTSILYASRADFEKQGQVRFHSAAHEHYEVIELNWRRKNGDTFPGEIVGTVIRDEHGEPIGFLAVIRDITDRKQAEATIQESQRKLSTLISNLPGAAFRCLPDDNWTMEFISDGCLGVCGYSSADIMNSKPHWADLIHPDDRETVASVAGTSFSARKSFQVEYRIRHRNGQERWIWEQGQGIFVNDDVMAVEGYVSDITELKQARAKLLQSERLAVIGQMLSATAHESRNALQRIQVGLDMLSFEIAEDSEARGDFERIARAKNDLMQLFEDQRTYAAPIQLDCSLCDLSEVWRQAWANLEASRRDRQASLAEAVNGANLQCNIDAFRVEQVFRNLFENALAACSDPVELEVSCSNTDIDGVPAVCVSVRDNGPGLTVEQKERIFEAFFTTKTTGTGLGMAIAQRTIEAHCGTIAVGNSDHCGAEFLITLPHSQ